MAMKMDKNLIEPLPNYVLVVIEEKKTKSASGQYELPENAQETPDIGEVISVSSYGFLPDGGKMECPVKVGDRVQINKYGFPGQDMKTIDTDQDLRLIPYKDLISILHKDENWKK